VFVVYQHRSVVIAQSILFCESSIQSRWQFRHGGSNRFQIVFCYDGRWQIGFWEITVIIHRFLFTHAECGAVQTIETAGFAVYFSTGVDEVGLTFDLEIDGSFHVGNGVHVFLPPLWCRTFWSLGA